MKLQIALPLASECHAISVGQYQCECSLVNIHVQLCPLAKEEQLMPYNHRSLTKTPVSSRRSLRAHCESSHCIPAKRRMEQAGMEGGVAWKSKSWNKGAGSLPLPEKELGWNLFCVVRFEVSHVQTGNVSGTETHSMPRSGSLSDLNWHWQLRAKAMLKMGLVHAARGVEVGCCTAGCLGHCHEGTTKHPLSWHRSR